MIEETQVAVNTAELNILKKVFDEHCRKQNSTQEKTILAIDKMRDKIDASLSRVYLKIEERDKKSVSRTQAWLYGIMASVIAGLVMYVLVGKMG